MGAVALRPVHEARLKNLQELIEKRFKGNASEAARAIERSHTFMWQLLKRYRSIGEETARHIEEKLELGMNALDAKLQRTKELHAYTGSGHSVKYRMVPRLLLSALLDKPRAHAPCPDEKAGPKTVCVEVESEAMTELQPGDLVFVDRDETAMQTRKLYLVSLKGKPGVGYLMQAKKLSTTRWVFVFTAELARKEKPIDAANVQVAGRVILVVRNLR